ncbi:MAG TPA: VCBS repeat-containing protein [Thermoanaerobaculia bacterium]|jgi:hypothetical protein
MKKFVTLSALLLVAVPLFAQLTPKPAPNTRSATVGDVNGDGLTDVIDDITWQRNTNGAFAAPVRLPISGRVLGVLDANGDGAVDLLTTDEAVYVMPPQGPYSIWMNDGHGSFTRFPAPTAVLTPAANGPIGLPPFIADFDGDGKDDFILPYPHPFEESTRFDYAFYRSRGDGTFERTDFVQLDLRGGTPINIGGRQRMTAGDVTGDGKTDVVVMLGGSLLILAGRGDGTFEALPERFTGFAYGRSNGDSVKIADIDGDRKNDIVAYGTDGVAVFFGDGHGGFSRLAVGPAGACAVNDLCDVGVTLDVIHYSSMQRWDIAVGSQGSNVSILTYSNGTLHETARVQLFPGESMGNVIVPPFNLYYAVSVVAGKFRTDSPADLYAFRSWDGPTPNQAFLVLQDKQAEDVAPPRRRAAGRPGTSTAAATIGTLTLRIVPSYVDLFLTGRCYGLEDTFELQRDGIFAHGTAKSGKIVDAIIEGNGEVIRVGSLANGAPNATFRRTGDGHYEATAYWQTSCQGQSFDIKIDAYVQ